jgi:replicative DNA helicase
LICRAVSADEALAEARRARRRHSGLRLVVVDYLQQMRMAKAETRALAVGSYSARLKALALELEVPVLACCQLNRGAASNGTPQLHQLKESSSLEQDADAVMLLHRDKPETTDYYLDVSKNRHGRTGKVPLDARLATARFYPRESP